MNHNQAGYLGWWDHSCWFETEVAWSLWYIKLPFDKRQRKQFGQCYTKPLKCIRCMKFQWSALMGAIPMIQGDNFPWKPCQCLSHCTVSIQNKSKDTLGLRKQRLLSLTFQPLNAIHQGMKCLIEGGFALNKDDLGHLLHCCTVHWLQSLWWSLTSEENRWRKCNGINDVLKQSSVLMFLACHQCWIEIKVMIMSEPKVSRLQDLTRVMWIQRVNPHHCYTTYPLCINCSLWCVEKRDQYILVLPHLFLITDCS